MSTWEILEGIYLDTHVWIWLMEGAPELGHAHQKMINLAAQDSFVGIAAISLWEVRLTLLTRDEKILGYGKKEYLETSVV